MKLSQYTPKVVTNTPHEIVNHFIATGVYVRQLDLQRGVMAVGRIHKFDHVFMLIKGKAKLWSSDLKQVNIIEAPFISSSKAGVFKAVICLSDCTFVTAHSTNGIEDELLNATSDEEIKALFTDIPDVVSIPFHKTLASVKGLPWQDQ